MLYQTYQLHLELCLVLDLYHLVDHQVQVTFVVLLFGNKDHAEPQLFLTDLLLDQLNLYFVEKMAQNHQVLQLLVALLIILMVKVLLFVVTVHRFQLN